MFKFTSKQLGMWFEIGRLLFPDLINRPRVMRTRMLTIFTALGLVLVLGVAAVVVKVSRSSGRPGIAAKPIKPAK